MLDGSTSSGLIGSGITESCNDIDELVRLTLTWYLVCLFGNNNNLCNHTTSCGRKTMPLCPKRLAASYSPFSVFTPPTSALQALA